MDEMFQGGQKNFVCPRLVTESLNVALKIRSLFYCDKINVAEINFVFRVATVPFLSLLGLILMLENTGTVSFKQEVNV